MLTIKQVFFGDVNLGSNIDAFLAVIEMTYSTLPSYWARVVPGLEVYVTNVSAETLGGRCPEVRKKRETTVLSYTQELVIMNVVVDEFFAAFCEVCLSEPWVNGIVLEQFKAVKVSPYTLQEDGTISEMNGLELFVMYFAQLVTNKDALIPEVRGFMLRVDQCVKRFPVVRIF